jgi:hypothetical protein
MSDRVQVPDAVLKAMAAPVDQDQSPPLSQAIDEISAPFLRLIETDERATEAYHHFAKRFQAIKHLEPVSFADVLANHYTPSRTGESRLRVYPYDFSGRGSRQGRYGPGP